VHRFHPRLGGQSPEPRGRGKRARGGTMNSKISPWQMKQITRNPKAHIDFVTTGRLPKEPKPLKTPLYQLLASIAPRDRVWITGIMLNRDIGYEQNRQWGNAVQLFHWMDSVQTCQAAASWADRRFRRILTIQDLAAQSADCPQRLIDLYSMPVRF